ncbi:Hypothetical protein GbCGDNIH1_1382 [Granulibacter bethesdensis CGDNIH1]|nr:Hypothetical protein GbCGDNIH1_1382 [Granulibacter bethesdensis CGDNIH1]APH64798.1 Hypothetical protein GbCGDNIH1I4_1382 [Granulibacter bethesdensis]
MSGVSHGQRRTIPAHAGEPRALRSQKRPRWDYPRARGGTQRVSHAARCMAGLSPRTRGNLTEGRAGRDVLGTIPAHAGEPVRGVDPGSIPGDYPRARGGTSRADIIDFKEQSLFSTF